MRPKIALVTSGVGTAYGGIGVVAHLIVSALRKDTDLSIWQHPASLPRMLRVVEELAGRIKAPRLGETCSGAAFIGSPAGIRSADRDQDERWQRPSFSC